MGYAVPPAAGHWVHEVEVDQDPGGHDGSTAGCSSSGLGSGSTMSSDPSGLVELLLIGGSIGPDIRTLRTLVITS